MRNSNKYVIYKIYILFNKLLIIYIVFNKILIIYIVFNKLLIIYVVFNKLLIIYVVFNKLLIIYILFNKLLIIYKDIYRFVSEVMQYVGEYWVIMGKSLLYQKEISRNSKYIT